MLFSSCNVTSNLGTNVTVASWEQPCLAGTDVGGAHSQALLGLSSALSLEGLVWILTAG